MVIEVRTSQDCELYLERVQAAANETLTRLRHLTAHDGDGLALLRRLKFEAIGRHPLDDRALNLIEQVNQTWTIIVSLRATKFLFEHHPEVEGFVLNIGTAAGTDILSLEPNVVAAEAFAATRPQSNQKLRLDIEKLSRQCPDAVARYVFFAAPNFKHERQHALETIRGIEVWGIDV
jgi:hypothetical protein